MTDHNTLLQLLGQWVTVTHPDAPHRVWHGQLSMMMDTPSIALQMPEGGVELFPQSFTVAAAQPATGGPHPEPGAPARSFAQLRDTGLLWLINRVALHPRGLALALHCDGEGQAYGWSLLTSDDGEPWWYDVATDTQGYTRAEETLAAALQNRPAPPAAPGCAVCGRAPVLFETDDGRQFCGGCVSCTCGQPTCPVPAATAAPCTAQFHEPFHGRARCTTHYPEAEDGYQHEGVSQDGSLLRWNDGEPGTTPHRPDTVRTPSGLDVRTSGHAPTAYTTGDGPLALTSTDTVQTHPDTGASGRPDTMSGPPSRAGLRAAIANLAELPADLLGDARCSCGQDSPLILVSPDGSHWHMDPTEYERLQRGEEIPHPAVAAWGQCWDRAENLRTRLDLARQVLIDDGYYTADQVGDDVAPRLVEWLSAHRSRVRELTDLLDDVLGRFTVRSVVDGRACARTPETDLNEVDAWRRALARFRDDPCVEPRPNVPCPRPDCAATREDLATAARGYETLRDNAVNAGAYISRQQLTGFPLGGGDNRYRILANLGPWATDPGPLKLNTDPGL